MHDDPHRDLLLLRWRAIGILRGRAWRENRRWRQDQRWRLDILRRVLTVGLVNELAWVEFPSSRAVVVEGPGRFGVVISAPLWALLVGPIFPRFANRVLRARLDRLRAEIDCRRPAYLRCELLLRGGFPYGLGL